jgi:hypothetical protein
LLLREGWYGSRLLLQRQRGRRGEDEKEKTRQWGGCMGNYFRWEGDPGVVGVGDDISMIYQWYISEDTENPDTQRKKVWESSDGLTS